MTWLLLEMISALLDFSAVFVNARLLIISIKDKAKYNFLQKQLPTMEESWSSVNMPAKLHFFSWMLCTGETDSLLNPKSHVIF